MSVDAINAVKKRRMGSTARKAVALVLADYCDAHWSTFVGQKRLADEAEVSPRTVRRILADFESEGLIQRERRHLSATGHRTSDRTTLNETALLSLPANVTSGQSDQRSENAGLPDTVTAPSGHSLAAHEPPEEPSVEPPDLSLVLASGSDVAKQSDFERFWSVAVRKEGKGAAEKAWDKLDATFRPSVLEAWEAHNAAWTNWPDDDGRFIPHPSTWLNQKRWQDDPPKQRTPDSKHARSRANIARVADALGLR